MVVQSSGTNVGERNKERCCTDADRPPSDHRDTAGVTASGKPHPAALPESLNQTKFLQRVQENRLLHLFAFTSLHLDGKHDERKGSTRSSARTRDVTLVTDTETIALIHRYER